MTAKRTELDKREGLAINNALRRSGARYDTGATPAARRERRDRDRAAGLVPFAVKLHGELVQRLQQRAQQRGASLDAVVDALLRSALDSQEKQG
jgi:hypothetical protein